jgi:hypothetical protein
MIDDELNELRKKIKYLEDRLRNPVPIHRVQSVQTLQLRRNPDTIRASELEEGTSAIVTNPNDNKVYHVVRNKNSIKKTELT